MPKKNNSLSKDLNDVKKENITSTKKTNSKKKTTTAKSSTASVKKSITKTSSANKKNAPKTSTPKKNTSNSSKNKKTTSTKKQTTKKVNIENKSDTKKTNSKAQEVKNVDKTKNVKEKTPKIEEKIKEENKIDNDFKESKSQTNKKIESINILDKGQDILDDLYSNYQKINDKNDELLNRSNKNKVKNVKKKKRRLKKSRVLIAILFAISIIVAINFVKIKLYNSAIYNELSKSKSDIAVLKSKNNTINLSTKTINYIKKNKKQVEIKNNNVTVYLEAKDIENNLNLDFTVYNKKLRNENFNNSKVFYIDSNNVIEESNKLKIKLPKYLYKNNIVDIYGVDENGNIDTIEKKKEIKNKNITFKPSKKYVKYFITYIKVSDIKIKEKIEVEKGNAVDLKIEYLPTTATEKEIEYNNIGDNFMLRNKNLIAKKEGEHTILLKVKNSKIKKEIKIIVHDSKPKIETKDGITYIDGTIIVNKTYSLPKDYDPGSLKEEALSAYEKMKEAAKKDNIKLWIASGFRSYSTQDELYNYYVETDGKEKADTYSARPGHSEHQTGLAMDLNIVNSSFEGTPEAIWLEKNSYKYGFIIRYPKGKDDITGYKYEPWHIRFLGEKLAKKVYDSGLTLEEYYNIKSEYSTN